MRAFRVVQMRAYAMLFGPARAARLTEDWTRLQQAPEIVRDLLTMGHIFEPDIDPETGRLYPTDELIARSARKSLVLALLARGEISHDDMNTIRQENIDDDAV